MGRPEANKRYYAAHRDEILSRSKLYYSQHLLLPSGERTTVADAIISRKTQLLALPVASSETTVEVHE